ncbi:hypothetical protein RJT34_21877 [Clitoria ternatea]|uniref:Uncharacterized protein n=1 Tax=Clitoria ternatea TaxID=43366 RepID=A0AAN9IV16_CLITE
MKVASRKAATSSQRLKETNLPQGTQQRIPLPKESCFLVQRRKERGASLRDASLLCVAAGFVNHAAELQLCQRAILAYYQRVLLLLSFLVVRCSRNQSSPIRIACVNYFGCKSQPKLLGSCLNCWNHCDIVPSHRLVAKCKYCSYTCWGGGVRMKHHLDRTRDNVIAYTLVPDEVREIFLKLLEDKEKAKEEATSHDLDEEMGTQDHEHDAKAKT